MRYYEERIVAMKKIIRGIELFLLMFTLIGCDEKDVKYKAQFLDWDDTIIEEFDVNTSVFEEISNLPNEPIREGYKFDKWVSSFDSETKTITIKANYIINKYTINWKNHDGSILKTTQVEHGELPIYNGETPTKESTVQYTYTFSNWTPNIKTANGNQDYTAEYSSTVNEYQVVFKDWDGSELKSETVKYGEDATAPAEPIRAGYNFASWNISFDNVKGNLEVIATYTIIKYTVSFDTDGGTSINSFELAPGTSISMPKAPTKTGYTFMGWDKEAPTVMPSENLSFKALWKINSYTVTFNTLGGSNIANETYDYNTLVKVSHQPTKNYNTFEGWLLNGQRVTEFVIKGNVTLTASWKLIDYAIKLNPNNGAQLDDVIVQYGAVINSLPSPKKEGYLFSGWLYNLEKVNLPYTFTEGKNIEFSAEWEYIGFGFEEVNNGVRVTSYIGTDTNVIIPNTINNLSVVELGINAFSNQTNILSIKLPDNLKTIGSNAFGGCIGLTEIVIPRSVTLIEQGAFNGCSGLINITVPFLGRSSNSTGDMSKFKYIFDNVDSINSIPNSLTHIYITGGAKINSGAFSGCNSITEIVVPNSVTSIAQGAFEECSNLKKLTIPFVGSSRTPSYYNGRLDYIFGSQTYLVPSTLENITITDQTTISTNAFKNCSFIKNVVIEEGLETIQYSAFEGCSSLINVSLPESVKTIGERLFYECVSLENIILPNGLLSLPNRIFSGCTSLKTIILPNNLIQIGTWVFSNCSSLKEIEIPSTVRTIGEYAFYGCRGLETINLPNGLDAIENNTFYNCTSLTNFELPSTLKRIGNQAFYACGLKKIVISTNIISIGENAFMGCYYLQIFTDAVSKPDGWLYYWSGPSRVYWLGEWHYDITTGEPVPNE
jgi:uncharacterized repeat protein (TIGR02543 family)